MGCILTVLVTLQFGFLTDVAYLLVFGGFETVMKC